MIKSKEEKEEKQKKEQNGKKEENEAVQGMIGGKGKSLTQKADNTKQKVKKIKKIIDFLKRHPLIAKALFWLILAIIIIILFTMIIYAIMGEDSENSSYSLERTTEEMRSQALEGEAGTEGKDSNSSATRKATGGTIMEDGEGTGKYYYFLKYGEKYDTDTEKAEAINSIKAELASKGIEIYNNQCLLFLAVMKKNGYELPNNKEKLEAMYMFFKAEIATSSLDLRSEDERNSGVNPLENKIVPELTTVDKKEKYTYKKEDYNENDYSDDKLQGNIRVQKITYNEEGATTKVLTYKPYEDFVALIGSDIGSKDASNYFTLDEDNNLIVAGWTHQNISYSFEYGDCFTPNIEEIVESQYEDKDTVNTFQYRSIPYLNYISKFTMPADFLSTLCATTDNPKFCQELAKVAETSHITITLHEEYSHSTTTIKTVHDDHEIIYATANVKMDGEVQNVNTNSESRDYENTPSTIILNENHYYDAGAYNKTTQATGNNGSGTTTYTWSYNTNADTTTNYILVYKSNRTSTSATLTWTTTSTVDSGNRCTPVTINNVFIEKDGSGLIKNWSGGQLAALVARQVIGSGQTLTYEELEGLSDYTKKRSNHYTITETIYNESNSYKLEVTEIDNWYELYEKTYSEIEEVPTGREDTTSTNMLEITSDSREITDGIEDVDYVQNLRSHEDVIESFIKANMDTSNLTDLKMEITKLNEQFVDYGKDEITAGSTGSRWKKSGTEKELVQVKVQDENKTAFLSIAADAFAVQNNVLNKAEETEDDSIKIEEVFGTTSDYDNGFLQIYDKYEDVKHTFNSIDEWNYTMLNARQSCKGMTGLLKYLIFLYDGTDTGVTEYDLKLLEPGSFNSAQSAISAIAEILKCYENESLRKYMNGGNDYSSVSKYVTEDRSKYKMFADFDDNTLDFAYGIMVYNNSSGPLNHGGTLNNEAEFEAQGENLEILVNQFIDGEGKTEVLVDASKIDAIFLNLINTKREEIKKYFEENDITLKQHEIDALVNISYQWGNFGQYNDIANVYKTYILDPDTPDYEGFFNHAQVQASNGSSVHVFIFGVYETREKYNRILFETGRYFLADGTEIYGNGGVVEFALQFVGQDHTEFTSYNPTNGVEDIWFEDDWCAMFVSYCYNECGLIPSVLPKPYAACTAEAMNIRGNFVNRLVDQEYIPQPGDIIFFTDDGSNTSCHTGIVVESDGLKVYTVEGNTGDSGTDPYWMGSHVKRNDYFLDSAYIFGYIPIN